MYVDNHIYLSRKTFLPRITQSGTRDPTLWEKGLRSEGRSQHLVWGRGFGDRNIRLIIQRIKEGFFLHYQETLTKLFVKSLIKSPTLESSLSLMKQLTYSYKLRCIWTLSHFCAVPTTKKIQQSLKQKYELTSRDCTSLVSIY